jgi:hypothetical protein
MQFTITPQEVEKCEEFREVVEDYPLYGHTDGLTKVEIVLLAKILKYKLPKELAKPIIVSIDYKAQEAKTGRLGSKG